MSKIPEPPKPVDEMTEKEKAAYAAQLTEALDSLRPKTEGKKPGDIIGEGLTAEYVPFTKEYFLDLEARRKEDADYQLHEVMSPWTLPVIVNGVSFTVIAGVPCKLPTPHYLVWRNYYDNFRRQDQEWAAPANPSKEANYVSPVHRMPGVWSKTPVE